MLHATCSELTSYMYMYSYSTALAGGTGRLDGLWSDTCTPSNTPESVTFTVYHDDKVVGPDTETRLTRIIAACLPAGAGTPWPADNTYRYRYMHV